MIINQNNLYTELFYLKEYYDDAEQKLRDFLCGNKFDEEVRKELIEIIDELEDHSNKYNTLIGLVQPEK